MKGTVGCLGGLKFGGVERDLGVGWVIGKVSLSLKVMRLISRWREALSE